MNEAIGLIAYKLKLCPMLLFAVCAAETNIQNVNNLQDYGGPSYGVCQVKLTTAQMFNKDATVDDLEDPAENVAYAGLYLQWQLKRYKGNVNCAVSAYNAGKCRLHINGGYVEKVKKEYEKADLVYRHDRLKRYKRYCSRDF